MFFVFILDKIGKEIVPKAIIIAIAAEILAKISGKSSVQIANNNNNDNKFIDDIVNLCVIVINIFKGFTININSKLKKTMHDINPNLEINLWRNLSMLNKLGNDTILNPANVAAVPKVLNSISPKSPISMIIIPIIALSKRHETRVIKANLVGLK